MVNSLKTNVDFYYTYDILYIVFFKAANKAANVYNLK